MRPTTRIALVVLPFIVLAGAIAARLRLQHDFEPMFALRHPIPIAIVFPDIARSQEAGIVFGVLALGAVGYALIVHDARAIPRSWLVWSGGGAAIFALAWPLVYSADIYSYAAYGIQLLRGVNPYAAPIVSAVRVPELIEPLRAWSGMIPRDIGGPLFTLLCGLAAALGQPVALLRVLAVAAYVVCVRFWPDDDPRGAAFFGAHPVVVWAAAEGHNDILAFVFIVLAWRTGGRWGWGLRIVAALMKAFAIVPLVATCLQRGYRAVAFGLAAAILVIGYYGAIAGLPHDAARGGPTELHFSALGLATLGTVPLALRVMGAALSAAIVLCCIVLRREGAPALLLAAWALFPTAYPWWATWIAAVIARNPPSASWAALIAVSFASLATYLPTIRYGAHISANALPEISFAGAVLAVIYLIPLLVVATAQINERRSSDRPPWPSMDFGDEPALII
jgi:hypothetical protein